MKQDNAFTGLEAAIVLIAFVVVAAVFSYVLLGAGFFATQKAQEVTYAGIQQTTSNMYIIGQIYGMTEQTTGPGGSNYDQLTQLNFKLGVPEGGQAQDVADLRLLYSNDTALPVTLANSMEVTQTTGNGRMTCGDDTFDPPASANPYGACWVFKDINGGDWSYINAADAATGKLVPTPVVGGGSTASTSKIQPGGKMDIQVNFKNSFVGSGANAHGNSFALEVKPRVGASYLITKTLSVGFKTGALY